MDVNARYVRVMVEGNNFSNWSSVAEIEIYTHVTNLVITSASYDNNYLNVTVDMEGCIQQGDSGDLYLAIYSNDGKLIKVIKVNVTDENEITKSIYCDGDITINHIKAMLWKKGSFTPIKKAAKSVINY